MTSTKALPIDKSALLELVTDGPQGTIVGRFSVFNVIDGMGDRTRPGCFAKAIAHLERNGMKLPLLYHHQTTRGEALIGVVDRMWETKDGAYFRARLDMSNPLAQRLYAIMSLEPTAMGVSMGFGLASDGSGERKAKDGANDLIEVFPLMEISLTTVPAVAEARVEAVKSRSRASTKVENLLIQLDAIAARGGLKSIDSVYAWDGLTGDAVFQWEALEARIAVRESKKDLDTLGATRCRCGKYITAAVQPPVSGCTVSWQACESCGRVRSFVPKSMSEPDADREMGIIHARVRVVAVHDDAEHHAKMNAGLEKARRLQERREIESLSKFATDTPPARPSKSDVKAVLDSFDEVLKPAKKSTPADPLAGIKMPGGRGEPHV
jgi:HK97 family phage prohead protease